MLLSSWYRDFPVAIHWSRRFARSETGTGEVDGAADRLATESNSSIHPVIHPLINKVILYVIFIIPVQVGVSVRGPM